MVVDSHPLWRREVTAELAGAGYDVVATVGDGAEALRQARTAEPDVVVMGLLLPDMPGARLCHELTAGQLAPHVLIFSASGEPTDVQEAVTSGASGYLLKSATVDELVEAVRRTAAGEPVFTPGLAGLVPGEHGRPPAAPQPGADGPANPGDPPQLSYRETEILRLVANGLTYKQVAEHLYVSIRTVQNVVHRIMSKLQLDSRMELVRYAIEHGLDEG
ncbi:response regulator [Streptomyces sp. 8N616]|uniref:response regulator n=1 Tax=Streptomyces sp. 8N616 TaxID=3457414 RepID=UPI003FCF783E